MFYLHLSNRTENLLARLVEVLAAQPRHSLFAREIFLIQSQGMERMLSQRLADAFPVWCNFDYMLPTRFFDHMAARLGLVINPDAFNRDTLTWRIDALLHDIAREDQREPQPLFAPILRYLSGEQGDLKRFQLAQQLANLFDQYQIMRLEMLDGWRQGKTGTGNPAEAWQMALWSRLTAALEDSPHRGEMLRLFLTRLHGPDDLSAILPDRISIFGLHSMPPLLLDCLAGVARHCDVHFYLLSPCRNYWADIPGKRQLIRENLARLKSGRKTAPLEPEIHPLLLSLGSQGRDFQTMLLERVDEFIDTDSFADPAAHDPNGPNGPDDPNAPHPPCLLHRLQSGLLDGGWHGETEGEPVPMDDSLTMVSCHSPVREIMVLKDQILRWLQDNPDLELRDIVVMAPDIQEYAAIIPAIFHDIQHSIADRSLRHRNRVLAVFFQFLDLAVSRCPWSSVLNLLEQPEIAAAFGNLREADIELIRHWVTGAGIRWGLSSDRLQAMGLPPAEETTWQAGLERLLLGYAMAGDAPVDGVLPYPDIEGGQARPLGELCRFIELLTRAGKELSRPRPLAEWSTLLLSLAEALFGPDTGDEFVRLREILTDLDLRLGRLHHHDIPLEVIRAWLTTTSSESRTSSGFLRGRLTFCSMLPMRSIPFRAVCLLGLNDGVFPSTDRHPPFNLLGKNFKPGDRSRRGDDRYQFLEALLSARQYLYLSHVGQSIRTGSAIPPSVLITELVETLRLAYGIDDPVVRHPLQPFSPRYFRGGGLFSYSGHHCAAARALLHPAPPAGPVPWWTATLPEDDTGTITVAQLLSFFAHPQRWFVRNRLDIHLDTEAEPPEENEPFAVSGLDGYLVNQDLVQSLLEPETARTDTHTDILVKLKAQGRWMLGAPGRLAFDGLLPELQDFAGKIRALDMGARLPDLPIEVGIRRQKPEARSQKSGDENQKTSILSSDFCLLTSDISCRLLGRLENVYEKGVLLFRYSACKGKDLLRAWIHHLLLCAAAPGQPVMTHLLCRDRAFHFSAIADPSPHLAGLIELFRRGSHGPSPLFLEPAWSYVLQKEKNRATVSPLQAAHIKLREELDRDHETELRLLYGDCDPADLLGPEFQHLCEDFLAPIFAEGRENS